VKAAVVRALQESFPYVRLFRAQDGRGFHFLASEQPIVLVTPHELAERMPARAAQDLVEWGPEPAPDGQFAIILSRELALDQITSGYPAVPRSRIIVRKTNTTCCAEICPSDGCPVWPYPLSPCTDRAKLYNRCSRFFCCHVHSYATGRTARHPA